MLTLKVWMLLYCLWRGGNCAFDRMMVYHGDYNPLTAATPSPSPPAPAANTGSKSVAPTSFRPPSKIASKDSIPFQKPKGKRPASLSKAINGQASPPNPAGDVTSTTTKTPLLTDSSSTVVVSLPLLNTGLENLLRTKNDSNILLRSEPVETTRSARLDTGSEENVVQKSVPSNITSVQQAVPVEIEEHSKHSRPILRQHKDSTLFWKSFVSSPDVLPFISQTRSQDPGMSKPPVTDESLQSPDMGNLKSQPESPMKLRSQATGSELLSVILAGNKRSQTNESSTFAPVFSSTTTGFNNVQDQSSLILSFRADNISTPVQLLTLDTVTTPSSTLTTVLLRDQTNMPVRSVDFSTTTTQRPTKATTTPILASWLHLYCGITTWASYSYCIDYLNIGTTGPRSAAKFTGASCPVGQFRCDNERCVYRRKVCNGRDDCKDNSDEGLRACPQRSNGTIPWTENGRKGSSTNPSQFLATADQLAQLFVAGNKQKGHT